MIFVGIYIAFQLSLQYIFLRYIKNKKSLNIMVTEEIYKI
jgi:hypothetical protein